MAVSLVVKLVASIFIGLTAVGWLLVVIGFGTAGTDNPRIREIPESYPYWIVSIAGPFIFIAALFHLFADKMNLPHTAAVGRIAGAIVSAQMAAFLSTFFLTGLGMILYIHGVAIRAATESGPRQQIQLQPWANLAFSGSLLATLFWTMVIILWHFTDIGVERE